MNDKPKILAQKLEDFELTSESKLYRYTSKKYLEKEGDKLIIKAKKESLDLAIDHYDDRGHPFISKEFGQGLSFLKNPEAGYELPDRVKVSIKLGDVLDQGGLVYQITSLPDYLEAYFMTLPEGQVYVLIEN